MSVILLRHEKKGWYNNKKPLEEEGFDCDPPIISTSQLEKNLIKFKNVRKIICSPFLRCRQTAEFIQEKIGIDKIIIDPDLREFLGNQKGKNLSLDPQTFDFIYNENIYETYEDFIVRIKKIERKEYLYEKGVLIVSHSLVLKTLINFLFKEKIKLTPGEAYIYNVNTIYSYNKSIRNSKQFFRQIPNNF